MTLFDCLAEVSRQFGSENDAVMVWQGNYNDSSYYGTCSFVRTMQTAEPFQQYSYITWVLPCDCVLNSHQTSIALTKPC
jgi:hypothetical protein